jgi:ectoine hydroxylase-related dioxygenase (phytanoyl-CoA dioxygenase family)
MIPEETVFDAMRLRWNAPQAVFDEAAVYSAMHRDTWFANPSCQINWWVPLFEVEPSQTFRFLPGYFRQPVENTSGEFDYDRWAREVGFSTEKSGISPAHYPTVTLPPSDDQAFGVAAQAGQILAFSAAHLHRTAHNQSPFTRFSIDFRTVHRPDHQAGLGAPNVDNASTGDASVDYFRLG